VKLRSPSEDFSSSLKSIPGTFSKLEYVARLRDSAGHYFHWGLMRVHGDSAARAAMLEVHQLLFSAVLRTPLEELAEDALEICVRQQMSLFIYCKALRGRGVALSPPHTAVPSQLHFISVMDALTALAEVKAAIANPPAS